MSGISESPTTTVRLRARKFDVPPFRDCLVIGRRSPIGCIAIKKALKLLRGNSFDDLHPDDDVVSDILVRTDILRMLPKEKLIDLILRRVKPLMGESEIMHIEIDVEVVLEDQM